MEHNRVEQTNITWVWVALVTLPPNKNNKNNNTCLLQFWLKTSFVLGHRKWAAGQRYPFFFGAPNLRQVPQHFQVFLPVPAGHLHLALLYIFIYGLFLEGEGSLSARGPRGVPESS